MKRRHEILRRGLDLANLQGLEIGPLDSPVISREDGPILYVDHLDTAGLRRKYGGDPNVDVSRIPEIDAIWGDQTLLQCLGGRRVDYIIASHVGEHVPDLVTWLQEAHDALKPGGELRMVLPDKRFSFDHFRSETRISDLLDAHLRKARRPEPREVIDFALHLALKMDGLSYYNGTLDIASVPRTYSFEQAMSLARRVLETPGHYEDVHCWVFTPRGFARLMAQLAEFGLLHMECSGFVDSAIEQWFEFYPFLRPCTDRARIVASWQAMEQAAKDPLPGSAAARVEQASADAHAALVRERDSLRRDLANAQARIAALEQSTSWKITAPLRQAVHLIRGA